MRGSHVPRPGRALAWAASCIVLGCAVDTREFDEPALDRALHDATGYHLRASGEDEVTMPPGVDVDDGVDVGEAVAIALWNNPDFATSLAEVGLSRARLAESGLLANPVFSVLFPIGPKQLEMSLTLPIETILERPARVAAARAECERLGANFLQHGLDVVRDVRLAAVDWELAGVREDLATRQQVLAEGFATAAERRFEGGDATGAEVD
ncbi:MAG: TolC family protein, partial [Planctomycetes bacterium]|nr:TolC family protein [Planctomycetota bacterium]